MSGTPAARPEFFCAECQSARVGARVHGGIECCLDCGSYKLKCRMPDGSVRDYGIDDLCTCGHSRGVHSGRGAGCLAVMERRGYADIATRFCPCMGFQEAT